MHLFANMAFVYEITNNENAIYITHEYSTAYSLYLMKKKYVLVIHSQGPRVVEMMNLGEKTSFISRKIISYCEKKAIENAEHVYFPSNGARKEFLNSKYCPKCIIKKEEPLYNTIIYNPKEEIIQDVGEFNGITFLSIGTMTKAKGQDLTIKYIQEIAKNNINKNIRWICIGKGPLEKKINSISHSIKYDNLEIKMIRKVTYNQIQYLTRISDIYIMLHRISIFDLSTLEAMKNNNAIILSYTGGNIEFNKENNIFYTNKGLFDISKENIDRYKIINKNVYEKYFSVDNFKKRYINVIKELTDNIKK